MDGNFLIWPAWLVSVPIFLWLGVNRGALADQMWHPTGRFSRLLVWSIFVVVPAMVLRLFGYDLEIAKAPLFIWTGLWLLVVIWVRYLMVRFYETPVRQAETDTAAESL